MPHTWAHLPDFCAAHADLLERATELPADARFHFEGDVWTGDELVAKIRADIGDPARKVRRVPWWLFRVIGVFKPVLRELVAMRYLWEQPVLLDGAKLRAWRG